MNSSSVVDPKEKYFCSLLGYGYIKSYSIIFIEKKDLTSQESGKDFDASVREWFDKAESEWKQNSSSGRYHLVMGLHGIGEYPLWRAIYDNHFSIDGEIHQDGYYILYDTKSKTIIRSVETIIRPVVKIIKCKEVICSLNSLKPGFSNCICYFSLTEKEKRESKFPMRQKNTGDYLSIPDDKTKRIISRKTYEHSPVPKLPQYTSPEELNADDAILLQDELDKMLVCSFYEFIRIIILRVGSSKNQFKLLTAWKKRKDQLHNIRDQIQQILHITKKVEERKEIDNEINSKFIYLRSGKYNFQNYEVLDD